MSHMSSTIATKELLTKAAYFFAGILLSTLVNALLNRSRYTIPREGVGSSDDSDDELDHLTCSKPSADSKKWGLRDGPYKMILCVNKELKMGKGKIAAQCCHAAVGCYKRAGKQCPGALRAWEMTGCAKVAVQCPTEAEMEEILSKAYNKGVPVYLVEDAGRTQIAAGSRTVLGLGPAPVSVFDGLTSHLKLM